MKTIILNFAKGAWYPAGQRRLVESLAKVGYTGDLATFTDESQLGVPPHREQPYAFKVAAVKGAMERGYDLALWADSAVWAHQPLDRLWAALEETSHLFFEGGWNCGQWCNDACLAHFGITREQAKAMPMFMACCMGFNFHHDVTKEFVRRWEAALPTFPGAWNNDARTESQDPYCMGHRHDQSAGSIIAAQLGMEQIVGHYTHFQYYYDKPEEIGETVCLLSQGM